MALLVLLLLPILCATVPQWRLAILPRGWSDSISQSQVMVDESRDEASRSDQRSYSSRFGTLASASSDLKREPKQNIAIAPIVKLDRRSEGVLNTKIATSVRWSIGWLLLAVWVVGALLAIAPLLRGVLALAALRRSATGVSDAESVDLLSELCSRLRIGRRVEILRSERSIIPMTWGVLRPMVIVPQSWVEWGTEN